MTVQSERVIGDSRITEYIPDNMPYTIIGHGSLLTSFDFLLTQEGLRKALEQCNEEDSIRIEVDQHGSRILIVRSEHIGEKKKRQQEEEANRLTKQNPASGWGFRT